MSAISASNPEDSVIFAIESIAGAFIRVLGFCIISVIPLNEFDIIEKMVNSYKLRSSIIALIQLFSVLGVIADKTYMKNEIYFNALVGVAVASFGIEFFAYKPTVSYSQMQLIINSIVCLLGLTIAILNLDTYQQLMTIYALIAAILWFFISFLIIIVGLNDFRKGKYNLLFSNQLLNDEDKDHWGAVSTYNFVYILFFLFMAVMFVRAIGYVMDGQVTVAVYWFLAGIADVLPIIAIGILGQKRCFTLLARYYEYNISTLQRDGACLAQLVSKSVHVHETDVDTKIVWVYRKQDNKRFINNNEVSGFVPVNRRYWMAANPFKLDDKDCKEVTVSRDKNKDQEIVTIKEYEGILIRYESDINTKLVYYFEGSKLITTERAEISNTDTVEKFDQWRDSNFYPNQLVKSVDGSYVVIRREKNEKAVTSSDELIRWANNNMRKLEWGNHSKRLLKRLFKQSPRDIGSAFNCTQCTAREKESLYGLTKSVTKITFEWDKIDFFVSHSWEDDYKAKWASLSKFSDEFYIRNSRFPTYWLDKVCINQKETSRALEVLPINIASSKQVLILMSKTYLNRLWCIWELYTLFTFSSKELAMERLEIVFLDDMDPSTMIDEIEKLTTLKSPIDHSHCFGPDEEYKLRHIIHDVGVENLNEALKAIVLALKSKYLR